jgi:hypothetical protein
MASAAWLFDLPVFQYSSDRPVYKANARSGPTSGGGLYLKFAFAKQTVHPGKQNIAAGDRHDL